MTVYIGIDWSEKKHDLCFLNQVGQVLQTLTIARTPSGFLQLEQARQRVGVQAQECVVGIETHHNLLIDFLIERGYTQLYVLPPNAVKSARGRYWQSGSKSDPQEAHLIADMLRTDLARYHAWVRDQPLTVQIRARISLIGYLNKEIWQLGNRLRAALIRYYPAALEIFSSLDSLIPLAWIQEYPTPEAAQATRYAEFQDFLHRHHHTQPRKWAACYARLQQAQVTASTELAQVYAQEAALLAQLMSQLVQAKTRLLTETDRLFQQHPDGYIYHSLPGTAPYL